MMHIVNGMQCTDSGTHTSPTGYGAFCNGTRCILQRDAMHRCEESRLSLLFLAKACAYVDKCLIFSNRL